MVITSRRDTGGLEAPAITIATRNPDTGIGWRNASSASGYIIQTVCNFSTSQDMENCIIRHTFEQNELAQNVLLGLKTRRSIMNSSNDSLWTEDFTISWNGRTYTMNIPDKIGPNDMTDQLFITFDPKLDTNKIFLHDPGFFIQNDNPNGIPSLNTRVHPKNSKSCFYRLGLTKVQELDVAEDPCNTDIDYNFLVSITCSQKIVQCRF